MMNKLILFILLLYIPSVAQAMLWSQKDLIKKTYKTQTITKNYKLKSADYQLISAAYNGDIKLIEESLERDASINNAQDSLGNTALWHAVDQGHNQAIQLLLEHGADFNCKNNTEHSPLQLALDRDKQDILNLFFKACSHMGFSTIDQLRTYNPHYSTSSSRPALHAAAYDGNTQMIQLLLDHGFDVNAIDKFHRTALHYAVQKGHVATVELLLKSGAHAHTQGPHSYPPLHYVINIKDPELANSIIKLLLSYGAHINHEGASPLYSALDDSLNNLDERRIAIIEYLLHHGAVLNAQSSYIKYVFNQCKPSTYKNKLIELLLTYLVEPEKSLFFALQKAQQLQPTANRLKDAIQYGYYSIVKLWLKMGLRPKLEHIALAKFYYDQETDALRKYIYKLIGRVLLAHLRLTGELQAPKEQKPALSEQNMQSNFYGPIAKSGMVGTYGLTKDLVHHIASFTY